MIIHPRTLILAFAITMIIAYMAIIFILLLYTSMQHKNIIEKIKKMTKEKEKKAMQAKKEKEQKEAKIHLETRIENFLKANDGIRFTEQDLKTKIARNIQDLASFHGILITLTHFQRRLGFDIQADHTDPKKPIFYYCYNKPK